MQNTTRSTSINWTKKGTLLVLALASLAMPGLTCALHHPDGSTSPACGDCKQIAQAQPVDSSTTPQNTQAMASPQPLQGSVVKTVKEAETGLNSLAHTLGQLKHADTQLYNESTRETVNLVEEPEIIAGTVIYIPVNFTTGDYLPPRKKWVDYYMNQLGQLISMVQEDVEAILVPDDKEAKVAPYMTAINGDIEDVQSQYKILQELTVRGPVYNNNAMAAMCHNIDHEIKQMDEKRKKAYHEVR